MTADMLVVLGIFIAAIAPTIAAVAALIAAMRARRELSERLAEVKRLLDIKNKRKNAAP